MSKPVKKVALADALASAGQKAPTVDELLKDINYGLTKVNYVPSVFALEMINFIKLIHGEEGTQNKTPEVHLKVLDNFDNGEDDYVVNMMHRGFGKSTLIKYIIFYMAVFGGLPTFGEVTFAMYVSDSMDNGISVMRKDIEFTWENSVYLQQALPVKKITEARWEFHNEEGKQFVVRGYGAKSGVRGTREKGLRPQVAILDDLVSDDDARSPTVLRTIKDTVYRAIDMALDPNRHKVFWMGTPFNAGDPLYEAVESGFWKVNLYPVCEDFPVERDDFRGSWEDRFDYDYVLGKYLKALATGEIASFNQELMLKIMSEEDRLIKSEDIRKFELSEIMKYLHRYNLYITSDIATSEKQSADFSVVDVWALDSNYNIFWIDGICERQTVDKTFNDIFRLAREYRNKGNLISVGVESSGQQGGFISLIETEMSRRNNFFVLARQKNTDRIGIKPTVNKMQRFNNMVPLFKSGKMFFPSRANNPKATVALQEHLHELSLACVGGFKSKHDDAIDATSMLSEINLYFPDEEIDYEEDSDSVYRLKGGYDDGPSPLSSYTV